MIPVERYKFVQDFLEKTAYSSSDILSLSYETRTFLMRNGGLYRMSESGKVIHKKGPSPDPSERL